MLAGRVHQREKQPQRRVVGAVEVRRLHKLADGLDLVGRHDRAAQQRALCVEG